MSKAKFIFFDVGNTLVDETPVWLRRSFLHAQTQEAQSRGITQAAVMRAFERASVRRETPYASARALLGLTERFPYESDLDEMYPEAPEVLKILSDHYPLGVIANQQEGLRERLARMNILSFFDVVISSEDYSFRKPDPRLYLEGLKAVGLEAPEVVMVGDRLDNDVIPANSLGIQTVRILQGFGKLQICTCAADTPKWQINSLKELIPLFT